MNDTAQKVLTDLLQKASNGIDSAVAFSQAQIPDIVHQLLMWKFVSSLICMSASAAIFISCLSFVFWSSKQRKEGAGWTRFMGDSEISSVKYDFTVIASIIFTGISLCVFLSSFEWLKIWIAPKLYLMEYAASLIK